MEFIVRLKKAGAKFLRKRLFHSLLFRLPDRLQASTFRLRQEGEVVKLTYKSPVKTNNVKVKAREELEVTVSDFAIMKQILTSLGYCVNRDLVKTREEYSLEGASIVIDEYKGKYAVIAPYVEIEARDSSEVVRIAGLLGYAEEDLSAKSLRDFVVEYDLGEEGEC